MDIGRKEGIREVRKVSRKKGKVRYWLISK